MEKLEKNGPGEKLGILLGIKPGEGLMTFLSLAIYFCQGFAGICLLSASMAIFLSHFQAGDLAYVYILGALAIMGTGGAFSTLQGRVALTRLTALTFMFLFFTLLGGRLWLSLGPGSWASLFLATLSIVFTALTNISVWGLCSRLFNVRQAKRLFALINSGEVAAQMLAGFITPYVAVNWGTPNLLYLSAAAVGISLVLTMIMAGYFKDRLSVSEDEDKKPRPVKSNFFLKERYPRLLHVLMALSVMIFYLAEVAFNSQAEIRYIDPITLAGFFGHFYAAGSIILLLIGTLLSGRLINRLGTILSLFLLPAGLFFVCSVVASVSLFQAETSSIVFYLVIALKMFDYVLRFSIHETSFLVLYQPLSVRKRLMVQTSVQSWARPAATILVGGLLLLLDFFGFKPDILIVSSVMLLVLAIWLGNTLVLRKLYPQVLLEALKKRRFSMADPTFASETGLNALIDRLKSPHPGEVLYALELVEENFPGQMADQLIRLLDHPSEPVRVNALSRLEILRPQSARETVKNIILNDRENVSIRAAAVLTFASIDESEALVELTDFMDHKNPQISRNAMVGLLKYGGIEGIMIAGDKLMRMLASLNNQDRESAARIMGDVGIYSFYRPLGPLLKDRSAQVRKAALSSAEKLKNPCLAPHLIDNLAVPEVRGPAVKALASIGEPVLPELTAAFNLPTQQRDILVGIIKTAAAIPGARAESFLIENIFFSDVTVRRHVMFSLYNREFEAPADLRPKIKDIIKAESEAAVWLLTCLASTSAEPNMVLLTKALNDELDDCIARLLALLSFISPSKSIREVWRNLKHKSQSRQAYAMEMIDVIIEEEIKKMVLPLLESASPQQKLEIMGRQPNQGGLSGEVILVDILAKERAWVTPWTQTTALYAMGLSPSPTFRDSIDRAVARGDYLLQETGRWALDRLRLALSSPE